MDSTAGCVLCMEDIPDDQLKCHAQNSRHIINYLKRLYTSNRSFLLQEKYGIKIVTDEDTRPHYIKEKGGTIYMCLKKEHTGETEFYVCNTNDSESVDIRDVMQLYPCSCIDVTDEHGLCQGLKIVRLKAGSRYKFVFKAAPRHEDAVSELGGHTVQELPLVFICSLQTRPEPIYVMKILCVEFLDEVGEGDIVNNVYVEKCLSKQFDHPPLFEYFVRGRPLLGQKLLTVDALTAYYYPPEVLDLVRYKFSAKKRYLLEAERFIKDLMEKGLSPDNYSEWYRFQLWVEEIQREKQLRRYHQYGVTFDEPENAILKSSRLLRLKVPGLTENRPAINIGDSVFVRRAGEKAPIFEGIVHEVRNEFIYLGFGKQFLEMYSTSKFLSVDVQFWFSRIPLIRCHEALLNNSSHLHLLFPSRPLTKCPDLNVPLEFFDARVQQNREQREAVRAIVCKASYPAPYVLFGPPGTGKTSTLVEAIRQVHKLDEKCRILISAPSNAACDVIAERLLKYIPQHDIRRIYSLSRSVHKIPKKLHCISNILHNEVYKMSARVMRAFKIMLTTFVSTGHLDGMYFTHIFLDEAGQGTEPETLLPLHLLAKNGLAVLAGDPNQLGPVIMSKVCWTEGKYFHGAGLDLSFLERLMKMPLYDCSEGAHNGRFVTKLLDNYRSHHDILHIPNMLFYGAELRAKGAKQLTDNMLEWKKLPNHDVPLIFRGVNGKDAREGTSPSYFNRQEVSEVVELVTKLRFDMKLKPKDIGIISPYNAQVHKLRSALLKKFSGWSDGLLIGSPEQFQGDERRVIIVSTVRASAELLYEDINNQLGFVRNPKRFNVTVTRAQALLIVVGCPWLLQRDPNWSEMLKYCLSKYCYEGCRVQAFDNCAPSVFQDIQGNFLRFNFDKPEK